MQSAEEKLQQILSNQKMRIRKSYDSNDVVLPLIEFIRSLDYNTYILSHDVKNENSESLMERYRYGWSLAFMLFYKDLEFQTGLPLFKFDNKQREWVDSIIQVGGVVQLCNQFLDYKKAGLFKLKFDGNRIFTFQNKKNMNGIEYYDKLSLAYYHQIMEKIHAERISKCMEEISQIREKLKSIVNIFGKNFISYSATDEIDIFYTELAYLYMMTTHIIDDFDENDVFGRIPYKDYLAFLESIFHSAIMHRDCCIALSLKTNHKIYIRNILSFGFSSNKFCEFYGNYMDWEPEKVKEILSGYTLNKHNYLFHISYPGVDPPAYFEINSDTLIRSSFGCLNKPLFFLIRELKRKYPKDYFNAVNNRESRFRQQLYDLFSDERITKINHSIKIKTGSSKTDIDAVLFDRKRNILGLFQLKWQDSFSSSMKERFSRISNLFPKSVEWIDKVEEWIRMNDSSSILNSLKIKNENNKIEDIYLFIISRNQINFTGEKLDDRAIWGSWFQLLEAQAKVKNPFKTNPIGELASKLKFFYPASRQNFDKLPESSNSTMLLGDYCINLQFNSNQNR